MSTSLPFVRRSRNPDGTSTATKKGRNPSRRPRRRRVSSPGSPDARRTHAGSPYPPRMQRAGRTLRCQSLEGPLSGEPRNPSARNKNGDRGRDTPCGVPTATIPGCAHPMQAPTGHPTLIGYIARNKAKVKSKSVWSGAATLTWGLTPPVPFASQGLAPRRRIGRRAGRGRIGRDSPGRPPWIRCLPGRCGYCGTGLDAVDSPPRQGASPLEQRGGSPTKPPNRRNGGTRRAKQRRKRVLHDGAELGSR